MLHILFVVLAAIVGAWLSLSSIVWIYWTFKPHKKPSQSEGRGTYWTAVGALFGFAGFFAGGFYAALFIIPHSWGGLDEDGEGQKNLRPPDTRASRCSCVEISRYVITRRLRKQAARLAPSLATESEV